MPYIYNKEQQKIADILSEADAKIEKEQTQLGQQLGLCQELQEQVSLKMYILLWQNGVQIMVQFLMVI